ncbi:MAG: methyltransferase domain-containing protein [Alphaproteobacteria bacterium]|nr:methyltransferase domain-containing protein [Alphaproteobacteria bacterium]
MLPECVDAHAFYKSETGRTAQKLLRKRLKSLWPSAKGEKLLLLGCASLVMETESVLSCRLNGADAFLSLVDSCDKPFADASIDAVACLHVAAPIEPLLHEIWRVLKGEGRLILIVPRLNSAWSNAAQTPFAHEPAYSSRQIVKVLKRQFFFVRRVDRALYAPPSSYMAREIEKIAPWFLLQRGGGVLIVEAQKRVAGAIGCREKIAKISADKLFPLPLPI